MPAAFTLDETFDVRVDTRSPVDDNEIPFRFTGNLNSVTFKLGPMQLTSGEQRTIQHARAKARD